MTGNAVPQKEGECSDVVAAEKQGAACKETTNAGGTSKKY